MTQKQTAANGYAFINIMLKEGTLMVEDAGSGERIYGRMATEVDWERLWLAIEGKETILPGGAVARLLEAAQDVYAHRDASLLDEFIGDLGVAVEALR